MGKASPLHAREIAALVALVDEDRLSDAEQGARSLLKTHPGTGILWKILSVTLVRQHKDAVSALRKTTELMPSDAEAHRNLGAALIDGGNAALGLESLQRALSLAPHDTEYLVEAADAMKGMGRAREAVHLYRQALRNNPRLVEAQNNLGNAFLELASFADAAVCYRTALQLRPDDAQILCNLSNAERQLGNLDHALAFSHRSLALDPASSIAHNNHGLILSALGKRTEAVASLQQALLLNPGYVDALNNLGTVFRDLGRRRDALQLFAQAVDSDPSREQSHWNLGTVLFEMRRTEEAADCYRRALALNPCYAPAHLSLGLALRQQRRAADAEASCNAALTLDPKYVEALSFLGELRADLGRFAEAEELFRRAIAIDPDFSFAYFSIATHRKMTLGDDQWRQGAEALLDKHLPLGHDISLHYGLGKYFDDVKNFDRAFDHYRQANELTKSYGSVYDRDKLTETIDHVINSFGSKAIQRGGVQGSIAETPVFIVGMPRSGTSLTEQILASHPAVFGAGELPFWGSAYSDYRKAQSTGNGGGDVLARLSDAYLHELIEASSGEVRVVDKMPANFLYAGLIHVAFPRARIIHMQRHPIDTCLSIYFQNFLSMGPFANDFDNLAHYYSEYVRVMNHWRAVLPSSVLLEVPYESLVGDQEAWTRRMLAFIGLPWDPACMNFQNTDRAVITASKWQVRQKISSASAGRWRNYEKFVGPLLHLMELR